MQAAASDDGLQRFPGFFGGVIDDCQRRARHLSADYTTAVKHFSKTLSAALFMFFATLFSTVALGALIEKKTGSRIGLSEYLMMNSAAGVTHALFGAQPLLVLRPTGPITAILSKMSDAADQLGLDFYLYLSATGVCISLLMLIVAGLELSRHIARITPFTHDIFACFVCSIYVHDGVSDVLGRFDESTRLHFGDSLFATNLALVTFGVSAFLAGAIHWRVFPRALKQVLSDYAVTLAVVLTTLLSYQFPIEKDLVPRISLPSDLSPSCYLSPGGGVQMSGSTQQCLTQASAGASALGRPWVVPLLSPAGMSPFLWFVAAASAIPITFFFYMDQNISSLLCQTPEMNLRRGHYFNSSFLAMGIFNFCGPLFGLPFVTGSLPHSPQFVRALSLAPRRTKPGGTPALPEVAESRVAPLLMYALIGWPLLAPGLIAVIPEAAIDGILAYVGYEGIVSTGIYRRVVLFFTPSSAYPAAFKGVEPMRIHTFTAMQLLLLALMWVINLSPFGLCVAFLVVSLVPLRELMLPKLFSAAELDVLDSSNEAALSEDGTHATAKLESTPLMEEKEMA